MKTAQNHCYLSSKIFLKFRKSFEIFRVPVGIVSIFMRNIYPWFCYRSSFKRHISILDTLYKIDKNYLLFPRVSLLDELFNPRFFFLTIVSILVGNGNSSKLVMLLNSFGVLVLINSCLSLSCSGSSITLEATNTSVFNDRGKVLYISSKFIL